MQFSAKVIRRKRARATSFSGNAEDQGEGEELLSANEVIENLFSDNKDDNKKKKNTFDDDVMPDYSVLIQTLIIVILLITKTVNTKVFQ